MTIDQQQAAADEARAGTELVRDLQVGYLMARLARVESLLLHAQALLAVSHHPEVNYAEGKWAEHQATLVRTYHAEIQKALENIAQASAIVQPEAVVPAEDDVHERDTTVGEAPGPIPIMPAWEPDEAPAITEAQPTFDGFSDSLPPSLITVPRPADTAPELGDVQ